MSDLKNFKIVELCYYSKEPNNFSPNNLKSFNKFAQQIFNGEENYKKSVYSNFLYGNIKFKYNEGHIFNGTSITPEIACNIITILYLWGVNKGGESVKWESTGNIDDLI